MTELGPADRREVFRYMGMRYDENDTHMQALTDDCEKKLLKAVSPKYLYRVLPVAEAENGVSCGSIFLPGKDIAAHLHGCKQAIMFCATLSAGADLAIRQASAQDVLAGLMTDAIANALVEQLCDTAEREMLAQFPELFPTWRFSPGYGDLPLSVQESFLQLLNAAKRLGVTLSESSLLIPTKTVTAIIGLSDKHLPKGKKGCAICNLSASCPYRAKGEHCS